MALDRLDDTVRAAGRNLEAGRHVVDRIVEGKIGKYYSETVLLEQPFVKNPDQTVGEMIAEKVGKIGENIQVRRFARYQLGEGLERREESFADEVRAAAGQAG